MLKTLRLVTVAVAAALALPAVAGPSWPPTPPRKDVGKAPAAVKIVKAPETRAVNGFEYVGGESGWQLAQHKYELVNGKLVMSDECDHAIRATTPPAAAKIAKASETRSVNGFEYVGGESGWQLSQHKYEFVNGKLAMSDECDHVIRTVRAPTPAEVEQARQFSPG